MSIYLNGYGILRFTDFTKITPQDFTKISRALSAKVGSPSPNEYEIAFLQSFISAYTEYIANEANQSQASVSQTQNNQSEAAANKSQAILNALTGANNMSIGAAFGILESNSVAPVPTEDKVNAALKQIELAEQKDPKDLSLFDKIKAALKEDNK